MDRAITPRRFSHKNAELSDRIPKKELVVYLHFAAQTLSRLKQSDKP
jgi:hypothetical protein